MMNKVFMLGYVQGVIESAPAVLSAEKTDEFVVSMTVQHLRHTNVDSVTIHDFLINDAHIDPRLVSKYMNLNADELESAQANILNSARK